jgi:hypothetical protein
MNAPRSGCQINLTLAARAPSGELLPGHHELALGLHPDRRGERSEEIDSGGHVPAPQLLGTPGESGHSVPPEGQIGRDGGHTSPEDIEEPELQVRRQRALREAEPHLKRTVAARLRRRGLDAQLPSQVRKCPPRCCRSDTMSVGLVHALTRLPRADS